MRNTGNNPTRKNNPKPKTPARAHVPRTSAKRHSRQQQIAAVTAMLTTNREHPLAYAAIKAAWGVLGEEVHHSTLDDWLRLYKQEVLASMPIITTSQIVQDTQDDIVRMYAEIERKGLAHAAKDETIAKAPFDKAMLGVGIARTKIKEMIGLPADRVARVQRLDHLLSLRGRDVDAALDHLISKLEAEASTPHDDDAPAITAKTDNAGDGSQNK